MFEGLVKRLLDTYLELYVDGITQNLHLAVWSGNIVLENLTLKTDIANILALPFHGVKGKIGRMSVRIPWASLGSTPIKIVVDSVYISIDNRTTEKTDDDILAYVRKNKNNLITLLEQEYSEYEKAQDKVNPSYLIRLSQKILNNIQIDLTNIHLHLYDEYSSFDLNIESISVRKSNNDEGLQSLKVETDQDTIVEPITHICSLLGLSIHETNINCNPASEANGDVSSAESSSFPLKFPDTTSEDGLPHSSTAEGTSEVKERSEENDVPPLHQDTTLSTSFPDKTDEFILNSERVVTLLEPSSFRLLLAINARNKSIYGSLCIGSSNNVDDVLRIVLPMDTIRSFTKIWIAMKLEAERAKRLMMQKAHTVALDAESIKGKTKAEFISLYTKLQNFKENCGDRPLPQEEERLQTLIDVIHSRHIARWKFACRKRRNSKTDKDPSKQASWFKWVRGIVSTADKTDGKEEDDLFIENLPGGLVLTEEELKVIKETMHLDEQFEDSLTSGSYYFECTLPRFQFLIDVSKDTLKPDDILTLDMEGLQFCLYLRAMVDILDKDTYEGYFNVDLDNFNIMFRGTKLMRFINNEDAPDMGTITCRDGMDVCQRSMNLRITHKMMESGNLLIATGELKPIETYVIPGFIPIFLEFLYLQSTVLDCMDIREDPDALAIPISHMDSNIDQAVLIDDDMQCNTDRTVMTVTSDRLPSFLAFDIKFSAPILILYSGTNDRIDIHFGTLILKTSGICPLSQISGTVELKETQISCRHHLYKDGEWFDFLRPLPVKIHFDFDLVNEILSLDVLFEEVFVQLTPLATGTLVQIPNELIKCISEAKPKSATSVPVNVNQPRKRNINLLKYKINANVLVSHSGFAVSNLESCEVFKLEMYNYSLNFASSLENISITLGLEYIMISNPAVDMPLFFTCMETLSKQPQDEFVDALEECVKSLEIHILSESREDGIYKSINASITEMEGNWHIASIQLMVEAIQEYKNIVCGMLNPDDMGASFFSEIPMAATIQSFKRLGVNEVDVPAPVGICDVDIGNELPLLYSEKMNKGVYLLIEVTIKGAAIVFCNDANRNIGRLSISDISHTMKKYDENESIVDIEVGTGRLIFGGRCLLAPKSDNISAPLLKLRIKSYDRFSLKVPYSMCLEGKLEQIIFVYFQQDISRLVDYLDDGILTVFISKSYHKVVQTAASTYMLFNVSVNSPCFIFPENKAILPGFTDAPPGSTLINPGEKNKNYSTYAATRKSMTTDDFKDIEDPELKLQNDRGDISSSAKSANNSPSYFPLGDDTPRDFNTPEIISEVEEVAIQDGEVDIGINKSNEESREVDPTAGDSSILSDRVDMWYFGSYLFFELGHLQFHNGYTCRSDSGPISTLSLKMIGTRALIVEQSGGSTEVKGTLLDSTDLDVCTRGSNLLEIGIDSEVWVLKLTRNQLTFIIDVFNENLCGSGYRHKGTPSNNTSTKESRYCVRMSLKKFQFNTLVSYEVPLAELQFNNITACLDYASNSVNMTSCYQFGFCSKTLKVIDQRSDSINAHRHLLYCYAQENSNEMDGSANNSPSYFPLGDDTPRDFNTPDIIGEVEKGANREVDTNTATQNRVTKRGSSINVDGLLSNWLKRYRNETGHDFFTNVLKSSDLYGIKFLVSSESLQSTIDCTVSNAVIPLLTILMLDIARYFSQSYSKSTMVKFPKLIKVNDELQLESCVKKVYLVNFMVCNGRFIAFTKMDSKTYPQLELSTDFLLSFTASKNCFNIMKIHVMDCELFRVYPVEDRRQVLCSNLEILGNGQYAPDSLTSKMFFDFTMESFVLTLYTLDLSILIAAFGAMFTDGPSAVPSSVVSDTNSELNTPGRYISVSFNVKGIKVIFFDDMRKSSIPMMSMFISSEKVEYITLPVEKRYNIIRCTCKLDYFNVTIGDWEPCLERCNFSLEYTKNFENKKKVKSLVLMSDTDDLWKDFVPRNVIKISSMHNILINITPSLCQLLIWFIPMLSDNLSKGLVYTNSCIEEEIENSAYRYINLTGYEYYAFTLDKSYGSNHNDAYSELKLITSTTLPMELDELLNKRKSTNACDSFIYLTAKPPDFHIDSICKQFSINNRDVVLRDLLVTRSLLKTRENLKHSNPSLLVNTTTFTAPFENGTNTAVVPLTKNCCVSLMPPLNDALSFTDDPCISPTEILKNGMKNRKEIKAFNVLCEVKTPHPSHKLLVLTSTVRIYNRSGIPLILSFLDLDLNPIYVSNLKSRTAPTSLLDKGNVNNEFMEYTTLDFEGKSCDVLDENFGYYVYLDNNHFLSVPEWAFVGESQIIFIFAPASLILKMDPTFNKSNNNWSRLVNKSGWSKMTDTAHHIGTRVRQCFTPNLKTNFLYFVVSVNEKKSLLPANCDLRDVVIYPSLSILNTLPMELDLKFIAKDMNYQDKTETSPVRSPSNANTIHETVVLLRKSITHIYSVPPNQSLFFTARVKDCGLWSEKVSKIYGTTETRTIFEIPLVNMAPLELELIRYPGGLPPTSNTFQDHLSLIINSPWLFIDRTGLGVRPQRRQLRPHMNGITFLSRDDEEQLIFLSINGKVFDKNGIRLPAIGGYSYANIEDSSQRRHSLCLITEKVHMTGLSSHISCRVTSVMPEYLFTNNLDEAVFIRKDSRSLAIEVEPGTSIAIPWSTKTGNNDVSLELKPSGNVEWTSPIHPSEIFAGNTFICLKGDGHPLVFCITIVPKCGTKYCSISKPTDGNGFILVNEAPNIKAAMVRTFHKSDVDDAKSGVYFTAKYGQSVHFGWLQPFVHKSRLCQVLVWRNKNTVEPKKPMIVNIGAPAFRFKRVELEPAGSNANEEPKVVISAENRGDYVVILIKEDRENVFTPIKEQPSSINIDDYTSSKDSSSSMASASYLSTLDRTPSASLEESNLKTFTSLQLVVQLSSIGISVVSQTIHEELFFLEFVNLMVVALCRDDHQRLELRISDVQIDNQCDVEDDVRTILVNRGKVKQDQQRHFLQIYIDRPFSGCRDLCLKRVFVALDDFELYLSDVLFSQIYNLYKECMKSIGTVNKERVDLKVIDEWLLKEKNLKLSSIDGNPASPRTISLDYLYIESFNVVLWCSFELEKLHMLGDLMRIGLRILSVSRHFELMGAPLQFQKKYVSISRGTLQSFYEQMKDRYLHSALSCIGSILGYSSLLNIPKLPITVGKCTIEFAAEAVDSVSTGLGSLLSKFTFDNEYINKRQRDRLNKPCNTMREGFVSAGKSIGEGFLSLTNIVTKPIEGAQKEGMGGFIKGLGKGIAGSIVKPIDKVGQAVSHMSRGIKANMSKSLIFDRSHVEACRWPRMLWGEFSQVKPYSANDANIKNALGVKLSKKIMHFETVHKQHPSHLALLFYPSKIYYVDLWNKKILNRPSTIWKIHVSNIQECRASSHGIIIKRSNSIPENSSHTEITRYHRRGFCPTLLPHFIDTYRSDDKYYQVPSSNASVINSIFLAFSNARKRVSSTVTIGPDLFFK